MDAFNRAIHMSTDLQCQQVAHELIHMMERMLSLGVDPGQPDPLVTLENDDVDRLSLMVARLGRMTRGLDASEEGLALRQRHAALEKHLAGTRA